MAITLRPELAVARHFPLAGLLWPDRPDGVSSATRAVVLIAMGTMLLTLSAKVNLPLPYVPMTLQTLAVLVIGATYGWRLGGATVTVYLAEGASGLPVFAGPVGGLAPLVGPTAGYLVGFVVAALATGWLSERGWDRSVPLLFLAMGLGHIIILASRLCMAWLRNEIRSGEGVAARDCTLYRGFSHKEHTRSGGCADDQTSARTPPIKLPRHRAALLTPVSQSILLAGNRPSSGKRRTTSAGSH